MKFFPSFCSCYRPAKEASRPPQEEEASATSTGFPLVEAKTSTTGGHARSNDGSSVSHWQPVLPAISEGESSTVAPLIAKGETAKRKKETPGSMDHNMAKAESHSYLTHTDDTYFDRQATMVVPAYSPAPMIF